MAALRKTIIGHDSTLASLLTLAQERRLTSLLIFAGQSGVGKKRVAFTLAQELICPKGPPACGVCPDCIRVEKQQNEKILLIEPETQQIKIEQAHQVTQFLNLSRLGRARVIIIDEAHRLNQQAANSLLKIFEEPPPETYFFLITQSPQRLPATIRSRAQLVRFSSLSDDDLQKLTGAESWMLKVARGQIAILNFLKEHPDTWQVREREALHFVSQAIVGAPEAFARMKEFSADRDVSIQSLWIWQSLLRDALLVQLGGELQDVSLQPERSQLATELAGRSPEWLEGLAQMSLKIEEDLQNNTDRTLLLENFYFKLAAHGV